jgi:hypothetical protein
MMLANPPKKQHFLEMNKSQCHKTTMLPNPEFGDCQVIQGEAVALWSYG